MTGPQEFTPKGEGRRIALLDATLRIIVREGPAAVTHRSVAKEAGATHGSVAYYFGGRVELLERAPEQVSDANIAWLENAQNELLAAAADIDSFSTILSSLIEDQLLVDRDMGLSVLELHLAAARDPDLRGLIRRWGRAYAEASETVLRALGSSQPGRDTQLLAALINGLILEQLSAPRVDFRASVLSPTLTRVLRMIAGREGFSVGVHAASRDDDAPRGAAATPE